MKILPLCPVLLALSLSLSVAAQGADPSATPAAEAAVTSGADAKPGQLLGHWHFRQGDISSEWTYKADGTFFGTVKEGDKIVCEYEGKWSLENGVVHSEYTKSSNASITVGQKDADKVVEVGKDYYIILNEDGDRERNERVK